MERLRSVWEAVQDPVSKTPKSARKEPWGGGTADPKIQPKVREDLPGWKQAATQKA